MTKIRQGVIIIFLFLSPLFHLFLRGLSTGLMLIRLERDLTPKPDTFYFLALGDSLTTGMGDGLFGSGFVPLIRDYLRQLTNSPVIASTYGVSGDKASDTLKRFTKQSSLQLVIKRSNLITLSVGGNDVIIFLRQQQLSKEAPVFSETIATYQKQLLAILKQIRQLNTKAPLYLLGLYNPLKKEISDLDEWISLWNQHMKELLTQVPNCHFVAIDHLFQRPHSQEEPSSLLALDFIHPNQEGYRLIAQTLMEAINEHTTDF